MYFGVCLFIFLFFSVYFIERCSQCLSEKKNNYNCCAILVSIYFINGNFHRNRLSDNAYSMSKSHMSAHNLNNYIQFDGVFNQIFPGFVISPFRYFNWRIKRCIHLRFKHSQTQLNSYFNRFNAANFHYGPKLGCLFARSLLPLARSFDYNYFVFFFYHSYNQN